MKDSKVLKPATLQRIVIALVMGALVFSLSSCGGGSRNQGDTGDTAANPLSDLAQKLQAKGRAANEVIEGEVGDTLTNTFFDWKIKSVTTAETLVGFDGDEISPITEGYIFLIADIETKNITKEKIPMGCPDYYLMFDYDGETIDDIAFEGFMDGMYTDETMLGPGDSLSGKIVFEIPPAATNLKICYSEMWNDNFEGNTYLFNVKLK